MIKVNIFDNNFAHSKGETGFYSCSYNRKPTKIEWTFYNLTFDGITVFTDNSMLTPQVDNVKCKHKVGWLLEPPVVSPEPYDKIKQVEHKFDYILTYDQNLLNKNPDLYKLCTIGSSRVNDEDFCVYPKTKVLSMIASDKQFAPGHRLRHEIAKAINKSSVDLWGSGYKRFESKLDPLKDYMFSIAIMNCKMDNFFTEVLIDCFATGTVPIFWGCPNIGNFFDIDGIITFDSIDDLKPLSNDPVELYNKMLPSIKNNLDIANQYYKSTDDTVANILTQLFT